MRMGFIGTDPQVLNLARMSVRIRWPDAAVVTANTAAAGLELVESASPDIVLLYPDFTDMSLAQTIQELRRFSAVPLLVLGYQADEMEVVTALEAGADDYMRPPCDPTEIMIRVLALVRRMGLGSSNESTGQLYSGDLFINPSTYEVFLNDGHLTLTSTEFRLLHLLVRNRGMVVAHQTLERTIWGGQSENPGLVKKYVERIRRKLGDNARDPQWIASVHGVGYRFIGPAPAARRAPELAARIAV